METFVFSFVLIALPLSIIFNTFSIRNLEKRVDIMINQHWDLLDYTSSNGVTSGDLAAFNEAKNRRLAEKEKEL